MTSSADGQDRLQNRLQELLLTLGLDPDEVGGPTSDTLDLAVDTTAAWLRDGTQDPSIPVRALQMLLADVEKTDMRSRECWKPIRETLKQKQVWKNAGNGKDHLLYIQALILAAWPQRREQGFLNIKPLLDSSWDIRRGNLRKVFNDWRIYSPRQEDVGATLGTPPPRLHSGQSHQIDLNLADALKHIEDNKGHGHIAQIGTQLVRVLKAHSEALTTISGLPSNITKEPGNAGPTLAQPATELVKIQLVMKDDWDSWVNHIQTVAKSSNTTLNLLWWGQSRYCRALRKPYLRMKSDPAGLLWWTAREAAELSGSVEVEPAAAYLVEVLHTLDQDIDEKKSVIEWMEQLYNTLKSTTNVAGLSKRLNDLAKADALGMPVTWVRRQVMEKEPFNPEAAKNDVALPLDEQIDRGDWASWVFRETLLDLHLAGPA